MQLNLEAQNIGNEIIVVIIDMDDVMSVILNNLENLEENYMAIIVLVRMKRKILINISMKYLV